MRSEHIKKSFGIVGGAILGIVVANVYFAISDSASDTIFSDRTTLILTLTIVPAAALLGSRLGVRKRARQKMVNQRGRDARETQAERPLS